MPKLPIDKADLLYCKDLHRTHGKSYFFATRFFPREMREATYVLYAFFRVPDEFVDNPDNSDSTAIADRLESWRDAWRTCYHTGESDEPVLRATKVVFDHFHIPYEYSEDFLQAMIQDVTVARYETYQDLEYYMYGSAAVVGLMMTYVVGFRDRAALEYAKKLGYAMQLTNFLRDIQDDYRTRGRIYMPLSELAQFGLGESDIATEQYSDAFVRFMQFQIERARALYHEAEEGIALLDSRGQFAVRAASRLYGAILLKIEEAEYNVFAGRVGTSFFEKVSIVIQLFFLKKI
jgi:phytoene synthase